MRKKLQRWVNGGWKTVGYLLETHNAHVVVDALINATGDNYRAVDDF